MTDKTQPEALRLAHIFDHPIPPDWPDMVAAAAELRRQHARIAELEAEQKACDTQLFKFYGVSTTAELIAAQARHIEKLQAKLPPTPSFAPQWMREG